MGWLELERTLQEALKKEPLSPVEVRKAHFDPIDKRKAGKQLLREQRHRCVFCECKVHLPERDPDGTTKDSSLRIAHWTPIAEDRRLALHWQNLYASCSFPDTCDRRQGNRDLGLPPPEAFKYERVLAFSRGGDVTVARESAGLLTQAQHEALTLALGDPTRDALDGSGDCRSILNLNHPELRRARMAALDGLKLSFERAFPNRKVPQQEWSRRASELLERANGTAFLSVQMAWLERKMQR